MVVAAAVRRCATVTTTSTREKKVSHSAASRVCIPAQVARRAAAGNTRRPVGEYRVFYSGRTIRTRKHSSTRLLRRRRRTTIRIYSILTIIIILWFGGPLTGSVRPRVTSTESRFCCRRRRRRRHQRSSYCVR